MNVQGSSRWAHRVAQMAPLMVALFFSGAAVAQAVTSDSVRAAFEARFPGVEVTGVEPTPFNGLYEIRLGKELIYADANVTYLLQGSLIDATSREDLTSARLEELNRVPISSLPLDLAVKQVKGDGSQQLVIFEDPNCGYCKQLHRTLESVDNITVHTLLYPILSPDSVTKSRNIWCAEDRAKVWKDWMVGGQKPADVECEAPIEALLAVGRELNVQGTPALFFADGSRVNGALPLQALKDKLASISDKKQ